MLKTYVEHDEIPYSEAVSEAQACANRKVRYRHLRLELGLGIQEISDRLGIHRDSWHRYESQGGTPASAVLERIHKLSGKDFLWLEGE